MEFILPDISMRKSDHMNIELITGWEAFTKTNLTINNTLFCATLFFKKNIEPQVLPAKLFKHPRYVF